jgi:predicted nucleic acid-binding protein
VIVVTDTSVVLNLCCLGLERLLQEIFGEVLAPPSVAGEFRRLAGMDQRFFGLVFPQFIQIVAPAEIAPGLIGNQKLHAGEIDALSLATAQMADAVLMDEIAGRAAAAGLGLRCIGILGVLIQAKNTGLLSAIGPVMNELESKAGFWIASSLRRRVLNLVDE